MEELRGLLRELGYSEEDSNVIINDYVNDRYKPETLKERIRENFNFFYDLGYTQEEIIRMTRREPKTFSFSIENLKQKIEGLKELGFEKEDSIKMTVLAPTIYGLNIETIKQNMQELQDLGYTQEEVIKTSKRGPAILTYSIEDNIKQKIEDMKQLGYTQKEIVKMTKNLPAIYGFSIENMKQKIEDMQKLGYKPEETIKMTKYAPIIYALKIDSLRKKIEDIAQLGYTEKDVVKMTRSNPTILGLSLDNITTKIDDMKQLGYTEVEITRMTKKLPAIFGYNIESMTQRIEDVVKLGYTQEEVIQMTKVLPAIFGYDIERIEKRIDFLDSVNLHKIPVIDPMKLMQSPERCYAMYQFFKVKGIEIDYTNYSKIFIPEKAFEKQYGITTEELLEMFPYEERENTEPNEERTKKIKARIDELEVLMHKNSAVENVLEQLEKIVKYSSDINTSDIKGIDTIKTLLERQNIEIDETRLQEVGLKLDYQIGSRLSSIKQSYREGSSDARATEEEVEVFKEKYGIILARRTMTQKFIEELEKLQKYGVDTSKMTESATIQLLIEKTKGDVDLERIKESFDLSEKIGQTYGNVKYAYGGKTKGIRPTEEEARIILEKFGISIEKKDYFKEAETILQLLQSCGVDTSLLKPADKVESIIKRSKKKTRRDVDIEKIEEGTDLTIGIGKRVYDLICADDENGKIKPLTEEQKKILIEQYGIKMEKKKIKSVSHSKVTYTRESDTSTEDITKEIEEMKKRAKALKKQEQKLDTEEQQPIVSQTTSKVQPTNIDDFSDEELDKFIEEMDAKQKEKEQRIERLKKIKRAKELIALSKQQDREISELESQIQKEGMDFNE